MATSTISTHREVDVTLTRWYNRCFYEAYTVDFHYNIEVLIQQ